MKITMKYAKEHRSILQVMKSNFENLNHNFICDNISCGECFLIDRFFTCRRDEYSDDEILEAINNVLKELENEK